MYGLKPVPFTKGTVPALAKELKKVRSEEPMSLNDLEFAYAPVRTQVRDLREYL